MKKEERRTWISRKAVTRPQGFVLVLRFVKMGCEYVFLMNN
jgi:hypothetical protein